MGRKKGSTNKAKDAGLGLHEAPPGMAGPAMADLGDPVNPKDTITTLFLSCNLTDKERLVYANTISEAVSKRARAEDQQKAAQAQIKAEITGYDATINKLAEKLNNGFEFRDIECTVKTDLRAKTRTFIRNDNGTVVKIDPLQDSDLQQPLAVPEE